MPAGAFLIRAITTERERAKWEGCNFDGRRCHSLQPPVPRAMISRARMLAARMKTVTQAAGRGAASQGILQKIASLELGGTTVPIAGVA